MVRQFRGWKKAEGADQPQKRPGRAQEGARHELFRVQPDVRAFFDFAAVGSKREWTAKGVQDDGVERDVDSFGWLPGHHVVQCDAEVGGHGGFEGLRPPLSFMSVFFLIVVQKSLFAR